MLKRLGRAALIAALVLAAIVSVAHVIFRIRVTYMVQREQALAAARDERMERDMKAFHAVVSDRLDAHEQIIFGELLAAAQRQPAPAAKPPKREPWEANRETAYRKRIEYLEKKVYRICSGRNAPDGCAEK